MTVRSQMTVIICIHQKCRESKKTWCIKIIIITIHKPEINWLISSVIGYYLLAHKGKTHLFCQCLYVLCFQLSNFQLLWMAEQKYLNSKIILIFQQQKKTNSAKAGTKSSVTTLHFLQDIYFLYRAVIAYHNYLS